MIAIAIIGVLAASLFPMMSNYMAKARDTATQAQIRKIIPFVSSYIQDHGGYIPGTVDNVFMPLVFSDNTGSCINCISIPDINMRKGDFSILTDQNPNVFIRYITIESSHDTRLLLGKTSQHIGLSGLSLDLLEYQKTLPLSNPSIKPEQVYDVVHE